VGLSICLSVREYISETARPNLTTFSAHAAYGRGSVLLRRWNALYNSGFVDDVVFS